MKFKVINTKTNRILAELDSYSSACILMHRMNQEDADIFNDHSCPYSVVEQ